MTRAAIVAAIVIVAWPGVTRRPGQTAPASALERVVVVDARGKPVLGLTADRFHVWSDGVEMPIASVTPDSSPFTAIVLLDATVTVIAGPGVWSSTPLVGRDQIEKGLREGFAAALRPGDRVRVGSIAGSVDLQPSFSSDRADILKAISRAYDRRDEDRFGRSPVWDAVWTAAEALSSEPGRRAIVLVTDGRATGNVHSWIEAEERAVLADAAVSGIGAGARMIVPQLGGMAALVKPDVGLQRLASDSGGAYFAGVRVGDDAPIQSAPIFARIVAEMQQSYVVRFTGPGDGKYHVLRIQVDADRTDVRARRVYFSATSAGAGRTPN